MYLQGLKEACVAGGPCVKGYGEWGGQRVGVDIEMTVRELRNKLGMLFLSKRKSRSS